MKDIRLRVTTKPFLVFSTKQMIKYDEKSNLIRNAHNSILCGTLLLTKQKEFNKFE